MYYKNIPLYELQTYRALLHYLEGLKKKREIVFVFSSLLYGLFLLSMSMIAAPIMTITMTIATTPYMSVLFEAKPDSGVAVGACVGDAALA